MTFNILLLDLALRIIIVFMQMGIMNGPKFRNKFFMIQCLLNKIILFVEVSVLVVFAFIVPVLDWEEYSLFIFTKN